MITKDKVTEIFCVIDEFDKFERRTGKDPVPARKGHRRKTAQKPQRADVGKRDNDGAGMCFSTNLYRTRVSHCALAVLGNASKHLVKMSPDIVVNTGEITNFFRLSYHELACF